MPNKKRKPLREEIAAKGDKIVKAMLDVCRKDKNIFTYSELIGRGRKPKTPFYAGMAKAFPNKVSGRGSSESVADAFQLQLDRKVYGNNVSIKEKLIIGNCIFVKKFKLIVS